MEKERENARMEAKRRKLMEKRVRIHAHTVKVQGKFKLLNIFGVTQLSSHFILLLLDGLRFQGLNLSGTE